MSRISGTRLLVVGTALAGCLATQFLLTGTASAVTATKAELHGGELRLEGKAQPGIRLIATSTTSAASARVDLNGNYKLQAGGFTAPDCKVTISDGNRTPTATVSLAGCTTSIIPVPANPAPPTGNCVITSVFPLSIAAGVDTAVNFTTSGCDTTTGSGATPTPVRWSVVAGVIPTGMTGPNFQGTTNGNIIGTPGIAGTYRFTLQVSDQIGATDQENVTLTVS
jgi:putative Ig domain-containing protein